MPPKPPFAKIAITLPPEDLAAADRLAATHDRSRSWIIAEALRQYVARESLTVGAHLPLDASRREQLRRDLALTPLERVQAAEATVRTIGGTASNSAPPPLTFENFDAFLAWNRARTHGT